MEEKDALRIDREIEEKRELPKEIKDGIDKTFFYNNIMAILVMLYFALINFTYIFSEANSFETIMKYIAICVVFATVVVFEIAYRKDNSKIALIGIELFICSLLSVYIPYIYLYTNPIYKNFMMIIPIFFAIYYIAKTIVTYIFRNANYKLNSISDIKEILSYDENKSYIDEDSVKTLKENRKQKEIEKELRKKQIQNKKEISKQTNVKPNNSKQNNSKNNVHNNNKKSKNKNNKKRN